jgi:hypothetical protein
MMAYVVADSASRDAVRRSNPREPAMPQRSFLGIGILIGLIAGAVFGMQYGNLAPSIGIGLVAGGGIAFAIDAIRGKLRGDN